MALLITLVGISVTPWAQDHFGWLPPGGIWGQDALAYWSVDLGSPYDSAIGEVGAFLYPPPMAMIAAPLSLLPWQIFLGAWTALSAATLWWLGRGFGALFLLVPPVAWELLYGNVHLLIAVAIVLGFRRPSLWAFVLLTKVTPGVGLVWFAVRGEWQKVAAAITVTLGFVFASLVVAPGLWHDWIDRVVRSAELPGSWPGSFLGPLWFRVLLAAAIVALAAVKGLRWPVLVAGLLALPFVWFASLSMLVGLVPLVAMDMRDPLAPMSIQASRPWRWGGARETAPAVNVLHP